MIVIFSITELGSEVRDTFNTVNNTISTTGPQDPLVETPEEPLVVAENAFLLTGDPLPASMVEPGPGGTGSMINVSAFMAQGSDRFSPGANVGIILSVASSATYERRFQDIGATAMLITDVFLLTQEQYIAVMGGANPEVNNFTSVGAIDNASAPDFVLDTFGSAQRIYNPNVSYVYLRNRMFCGPTERNCNDGPIGYSIDFIQLP